MCLRLIREKGQDSDGECRKDRGLGAYAAAAVTDITDQADEADITDTADIADARDRDT